jgi:hypothetical protein
MKTPQKTRRPGQPVFHAQAPLVAAGLILLLATSCSSLKVQKDAFVKIQSDVPLELGDENSTLGATNEWLPIYTLGDRSVNLVVKSDNVPLDTLVLLRKKHPLNRIQIPAVVVLPVAAAAVIPRFYPNANAEDVYRSAFGLTIGAVWLDRTTDNYRFKFRNYQTIPYELPDSKKERYAQLMKKAEENALADALRKPASELTTVDYLPESLRAKFGLTNVPLAAPAANAAATSTTPAVAASTPAAASSTATATSATATSATARSATAPAAETTPAAATPAATATTGALASGPAAGQTTVVLKNTAATPIRVYLSVEKSFVVRAASSLPVQVPAGAILYLAQNARPLQLKAVGTAPAINQPQITLDLQQILSTWE